MSDSEQITPESAVDRTKWIWGGIGILVLVMVILIYVTSEQKPPVSSVRAEHILITFDRADPNDRANALELLQELRDRIEDGENFRRLARRYSDDPFSAARGGDLNYHPKGSFDDNFEDYVWNAPLNELSEIIQTNHGFHLIRVVDRYVTDADAYEMELERRVHGDQMDEEEADSAITEE